MNVQIPPALYFMIAAVLIVFGPLRAYYFGWRHRPDPKDEGASEEEAAKAARTRRRHIMWGTAWFIAGVYIAYLGWQLTRARDVALQPPEELPRGTVRFSTDSVPRRDAALPNEGAPSGQPTNVPVREGVEPASIGAPANPPPVAPNN